MTKQESKQFEILKTLGLPALPEPVKEDGEVWYHAVAKVITGMGDESLVVVRNRPGASPVVVRTFDTRGVRRILSIHPYEFVTNVKVPAKGDPKLGPWLAKQYGVAESQVTTLDANKIEVLRQRYIIDDARIHKQNKVKSTKMLEKARAVKAANAKEKKEKEKKEEE